MVSSLVESFGLTLGIAFLPKRAQVTYRLKTGSVSRGCIKSLASWSVSSPVKANGMTPEV